MALRIYDTLTRTKEELDPVSPGKVGIYVCGVTQYDYCHIGHARVFVVYSAIVNYLRRTGFQVTFISNHTDVDDKIINRAAEEGKDPMEVAEFYIREYEKDVDALKVTRPDIEPRATEHMREIIELINTLIARGYAYSADGDVYFNVAKFGDYGKLSRQNLAELEVGARVEVNPKKRDPLDFDLWKGSKPGEPAWESPWGLGRPGWHIECSAMSMKYLGETFDIHAGGTELIFPHHENEIAQSECATDKPFAKYWMHHGPVDFAGDKMSKSLGNVVTLRGFLEKHHPEILKFILLRGHYRSVIQFSDRAVREASIALERLYSTLAQAITLAGDNPPVLSEDASQQEIVPGTRRLPAVFEGAMDDDFNTAQAIGHIFEFLRPLNHFIAGVGGDPSPAERAALRAAADTIKSLGEPLCLFQEEPHQFLLELAERRAKRLRIREEKIVQLIAERAEARTNKDYRRADGIRNYLQSQGIVLEDKPQGTTWRILAH